MDQFRVMGIVNITPDSFYDGGRYDDVELSTQHALRLVEEGAGVVDVGGSSSRPGAVLLSADEEMGRVIPVISRLIEKGIDIPISVDTVWSSVAKAAIEAGAGWVNDVSAGRIDPNMADVVAESGCVIVLTHSRGTPRDMQDDPRYSDVVKEVVDELSLSIDKFKRAGVGDDKIIIDPGFGFAKTVDHNIALIKGIDAITQLGYPVLVGVSRKSFIGAITGRDVGDRLSGTLAATAAAYYGGARIFRVHDVRETVDFLKVLSVTYS